MLTIAGGIILAIIFFGLLPYLLATILFVVAVSVILATLYALIGNIPVVVLVAIIGWIAYCYYHEWQEYKRTNGSPFS